MKYLRTAHPRAFQGKTILLRLDFNTQGEWRMEAAIRTIKFLLKFKTKIVIASHRGRPKGVEKQLSLGKDARNLGAFLKERVHFLPQFRFGKIKKTVAKAPLGSLFLLENLRFLGGEERNDTKLGRQLAELVDVYVNDAFAVCHRADASVVAVTKYLPSYAGLELEREMESLSRVLRKPKRPLVVILGGAKAHDKLGVLRCFRRKAEWFLLGGAPANTMLFLRGMDVKDSVADKDPKDLERLKKVLSFRNVVLPIDYKFAERKILDVGENTIRSFISRIRLARTIIWSGPLGLIEREPYGRATLEVAKAVVANRKAYSVVGGGETVGLLKKYSLDKKINFISTGGGAMLDFLAGEKLPGIEALKRR
ncbi:phosphoglycerate kinase [Candidatus Parcubacteria bacterium]|nr:MAG: phosphoglycerate kinase [Candidatus Parcubacteria bacterium]